MKHLNVDALPLIVTPHPLYDLPPDELAKLARCAFPLVVAQLTGSGAPAAQLRVEYERPASVARVTQSGAGENG